ADGIASNIGVRQRLGGVIANADVPEIHSGSAVGNLSGSAGEGPVNVRVAAIIYVLQVSALHDTVAVQIVVVHEDGSIIFNVIRRGVAISHVVEVTTSSVGAIHAAKAEVQLPLSRSRSPSG